MWSAVLDVVGGIDREAPEVSGQVLTGEHGSAHLGASPFVMDPTLREELFKVPFAVFSIYKF